MKKINLGCGTNKLAGWSNHDADVDITEALPWDDASVELVLAEHVVEHISTHQAIRFFQELRRILKPGGVARIAVPSIEQVHRGSTKAYCQWVHDMGWSPSADVRGALHAMAFQHGHKALWTKASLEAALLIAGFGHFRSYRPGVSENPNLRDVEGHGKVIGEPFNLIETVVIEAS